MINNQINKLPPKISICYKTLLSRIFDENNNDIYFNNCNQSLIDPIKKLILNYEEIKKILELKHCSIFKALYFIRNIVNSIIFNLEEIIYFDSIGIKKDINYFFI